MNPSVSAPDPGDRPNGAKETSPFGFEPEACSLAWISGRAKRARKRSGVQKGVPGSTKNGAGNEAPTDAPKAPKPFELLVFRAKRSRPKGAKTTPKRAKLWSICGNFTGARSAPGRRNDLQYFAKNKGRFYRAGDGAKNPCLPGAKPSVLIT